MLSPHLWLAWALSPKSASRRRPPVAGGARYHVEVGVDAAVVVHDEVARGVNALNVARVRVVIRKKPAIILHD